MNPPITLASPLPAQDLLFESMRVSSGLSTLDDMQLNVLSPRHDLKPQALLGKPVCVSVALRGNEKRHFHGYVTQFGMGRPQGRLHGYQARVRPWLWFLSRTSDCRIFQDRTVPEIVKEVFADHGIANFDFQLFRSYRKRVYCVQYRESDYQFVARLLENEGIYWYFKHGSGSHKLVLVDATGAHDAASGCASLDYHEQPDEVPPDTDYVSHWRFTQGVESGKVVLTSYDFERPSTSLQADAKKQRAYDLSNAEQFDFDGDYVQRDDGVQYAGNRLDEVQSGFDQASGVSNAQALEVGRIFKLARHPRPEQNAEYLVTSHTMHATLDAYESGQSAGTTWHGEFSAMPSAQQFRPSRRTARPRVQGPQTAIVTGPSGAEIDTDKYGRVHVQFHWDRQGKRDDKSSCWVRVSQPWAGKNFGAVHIPRVGQEVIVDFLEGDPDQPIITGRVHNAEQMPPWDLPANATQSGILTRSSPGGGYGNANAIRFEDKAGSEQVWIHAEKNQDIEVEKDETHWVGHDRTKTIDHDETTHVKHDRTETVDNNETITVHANRTETVDKEETIAIHGGRTETVDKDERITIHGGRTEQVDKDESISIDGSRTETVAKDETITINGGRTETVAKDERITINGGRTETVAKDESIAVNGGRTETVAKDEGVTINGGRTVSVAKDESLNVTGGRTVKIGKADALDVGKALTITAAESITLTTGEASITMNKNGNIDIKGKKINLNGSDVSHQCSGKFNVKASSDITMAGSKIKQN